MSLSDFDAAWAIAAPALSFFNEPVLITPMKSGNDSQYFAAADGTRQGRTVMGIYDPKTVVVRDLGRQTAIRSQTDRVDDQVRIDFSISDLGDKSTWPVVGDRLTLSARVEQPVFAVVAPDVSGHGRVSFQCVRVME